MLEKSENQKQYKIDYFVTIAPLCIILGLFIVFVLFPEKSNNIIESLRFFFTDTIGIYYLVFGVALFLLSLFIAFSKYGKIILGKPDEKPKYTFFQWGAMMFCAGLAADILFYSLCEWVMYITDPHVIRMSDNPYAMSSAYSLFHWGPMPWCFYLCLAVAFGFMIHVRNRNTQKFSESLRPLLGGKVDGIPGKAVDIFAIFALIAGCATTFCVATPLLTASLHNLFGIPDNKLTTIIILCLVCAIYTTSLFNGLKGINILSKLCIFIYLSFIAYVLIFSGQISFIIKNSVNAIGLFIKNFAYMSLYTDPTRETSFPQTWTCFYWAYWMVWCIAAPFFIGIISRGRSIKQTILGGYLFGLASTYIGFLVIGNWTMGLNINNIVDVLGIYSKNENLYETIMACMNALPLSVLPNIILIISMIAFYATSYDSISLVASYYSYKNITSDITPGTKIKLFWAILLILLPIALLFSESGMSNIQGISIIGAFPIGIIMILIMISFFKDAKNYLNGN